MDFNTGVFERSGFDAISARTFYIALGFIMTWGLGGTALVAKEVAMSGFVPGLGSIILLGLVVPIIGIFIALKSDNPILSFIGYNMLCIPFGVILSPILNKHSPYTPHIIQNAFMATACVTVTMMCLATIFPGFFSKLEGVLFSALLGLVVVRVMQLFVPSLASMGIFDWIGAGIFSLYIGYDWYRASNIPKTLDNAVDIALDLYLDIVNLFLCLLRGEGGSSSSD